MQAIQTKYLGPTNTRGGRIKAVCDAKSITVEWDHRLNPEDNHRYAAMRLILAMGWHGTWVQGQLPGFNGYAFVCRQRRDAATKDSVAWQGCTEGFDVWADMTLA